MVAGRSSVKDWSRTVAIWAWLLAGMMLASCASVPESRGLAVHEKSPEAADCHVPIPSADATIIRLGAFGSSRISNIAVAGQDTITDVAAVDIEPGEAPIYVVASALSSTIWQFTGQTDRLEMVVLSTRSFAPGTNQLATGAVGVPADKVRFFSNSCFGDFWAGDNGFRYDPDLDNLVVRHVGRKADAAYAAFHFEEIALPSMKTVAITATAPPTFTLPETPEDAGWWADFVRRAHGGLADFNPEQVIAPGPFEKFRTYPYEAGLMQLRSSGSIESATIAGDGAYRILKPIHLPPGLLQQWEWRFYLAPGVPRPTGDLGGASIWREADNVCLKGCRRRRARR